MVSDLPPVVPDDVALRVDTCPVIASRVDKRSWFGVGPSGVESEVISSEFDCVVSQGGRVAAGTEVNEKADVPKASESEDWKFVLLVGEAEV